MKLHIKYFASVRETAGIEHEVLDITAQSITLDNLRLHLASRNERMAEALNSGRIMRTAVNLEVRPGNFALTDDCEVAFFPPVTGG